MLPHTCSCLLAPGVPVIPLRTAPGEGAGDATILSCAGMFDSRKSANTCSPTCKRASDKSDSSLGYTQCVGRITTCSIYIYTDAYIDTAAFSIYT